MTWWQTTAIATVLAIVALSGVLFQLRITTHHQRMLSDADRREAREVRAQERRNAIEDHWRDRRHETHVEALQQLQTAQAMLGSKFSDWANQGGSDDLYLEVEQLRVLRRALAEVALVCGAGSNEALDTAFACLVRAQSRLVRVGRVSGDAVERAEDNYGDAEDALIAAIDTYRSAIRVELGTID